MDVNTLSFFNLFRKKLNAFNKFVDYIIFFKSKIYDVHLITNDRENSLICLRVVEMKFALNSLNPTFFLVTFNRLDTNL